LLFVHIWAENLQILLKYTLFYIKYILFFTRDRIYSLYEYRSGFPILSIGKHDKKAYPWKYKTPTKSRHC